MRPKRPAKHYHVYVLISHSCGMVKIGKANNLSRAPHLARMGYAGATDWEQIASFPVDSDHAAIALEMMICAHLSNRGHKLPRLAWTNLINSRPSYADECYTCDVEFALSAANQMASIYRAHVA